MSFDKGVWVQQGVQDRAKRPPSTTFLYRYFAAYRQAKLLRANSFLLENFKVRVFDRAISISAGSTADFFSFSLSSLTAGRNVDKMKAQFLILSIFSLYKNTRPAVPSQDCCGAQFTGADLYSH
jgi:hypothetical protein